jgi:hypothetical protein
MLSIWVSGGATVDLELGGKGAKDAPTVPQMFMLNPIKNIYLLRQPCFGNLRVRQPLVRQPLVRQPLGGIPSAPCAIFTVC